MPIGTAGQAVRPRVRLVVQKGPSVHWWPWRLRLPGCHLVRLLERRPLASRQQMEEPKLQLPLPALLSPRQLPHRAGRRGAARVSRRYARRSRGGCSGVVDMLAE